MKRTAMQSRSFHKSVALPDNVVAPLNYYHFAITQVFARILPRAGSRSGLREGSRLCPLLSYQREWHAQKAFTIHMSANSVELLNVKNSKPELTPARAKFTGRTSPIQSKVGVRVWK